MRKNVPVLWISRCLDRARVICGYLQAVVFPQRRMVNNALPSPRDLIIKKGVLRDWSCHRVKTYRFNCEELTDGQVLQNAEGQIRRKVSENIKC